MSNMGKMMFVKIVGEMGNVEWILNGTWNISWYDISYIHDLYLCHFTKYGSRDWALLLFANYLYSAISEVLQRAVTYCPHAEILWLMAPWNVWVEQRSCWVCDGVIIHCCIHTLVWCAYIEKLHFVSPVYVDIKMIFTITYSIDFEESPGKQQNGMTQGFWTLFWLGWAKSGWLESFGFTVGDC